MQIKKSELLTNIVKVTQDIYYDKSQILGYGATSIVYKGFDTVNQQLVACKVLKKSYSINWKKQLERQKVILGRISEFPHQNIMGYYGFQEIQQGLCLILQYCSQGKLSRYLESNKVSQKTALLMIYQLISGMQHFNQKLGQQYMHRDLKPDNIFLISDDLTIKIGDFGLAREQSIDKTGMVGTPAYAAPQINSINLNYDSSSDVWSAGLICYEILTGKKFYNCQNQHKIFLENLQKGQKISLPQYHPFWKDFLNSMIVFEPKHRKKFNELKKKLDQNIEQVLAEIKQKYDYVPSKSTLNVSLNNSASILLSSINPSIRGTQNLVKSSKHQIQSILRTLQKQQSYRIVNRVRKYLKFNIQVGQIYNSIITLFNKQNIIFKWKNVYKYMLMGLSTAAYVAKLKKIIEQIDNNCIKTQNFGKIQDSQVINEHKDSFRNTVNSFKEDYQKNFSKYIKILEKQIIPKLRKYRQKAELAQIFNYHSDIFEACQKILENIWFSQQYYLDLYKRLINIHPLFIPLHIVSDYDVQSIRQYYRIRVIGYSAQVLPQIHCNNEQFINLKKQQLQNASKQSILCYLEKIYE